MKQKKQMNVEIDKSTKPTETFSVPLWILEELDDKQGNKRLESTLRHVVVNDIYWRLYPTTLKYIFFSNAHGTSPE